MARPVGNRRRSFLDVLLRRHRRTERVEPVLTRSAYLMAQSTNIASAWSTVSDDPNRLLRGSLQTLRARSRDVARNTDYGRGFMVKLRTNVVGHKGVRLYVDARRRDGERDVEASDRVAAAFGAWGARGVCTACGRLTWRDVQSLAVRSVVRDGEFLAVKLTGASQGPYGFRLQLLDPDLLDETYSERLANGNRVILGVEVDRGMRPVAYHILSDRRSALIPAATIQRRRIPAERVIHAFIADDVDQVRGVPHLNPTGRRLYQLDKYEEAEIVGARVAASKMGVIEQGASTWGEPDAENAAEDRGRNEIALEPGTFPVLGAGDKLQPWDPQHPTTAFEAFVKQSLRGAAAGVGLSYTAFSGDLEGVNYSSIRQGALEDRNLWQDLQAWLSEHVLAPVFEGWLDAALLSGSLDPLPASAFDTLNRPVWHARGWAWVDPLKEVSAREKEVGLGVTSRRRVATELGRPWEEVQAELEEEEGAPREYGAPQPEAGAPAPADSEEEVGT